jgi:nucleotide-binding universal stress UspA family protein
MPTAPTIVCPIDFSEHSKAALRMAAVIANRFAGRLVVLHVNDPLLATAAATQHVSLEKEAENELREVIASAGASAARTKIVVRKGAAEQEILHAAEAEHADLVVMGTHGLTGARKLIFGSTTEKVLRETRVPVLAVPIGQSARASQDLKRTIIVPVDFSDSSIRSARIAAEIGAVLNVPVVLIHVTRPVLGPDRWRERAVAAANVAQQEALERLQQIAVKLGRKARVEATVVTGAPAQEIAKIATDRVAGLIVMGLRGAGGLMAPAVGSTAYRVLTSTPVPVLAIPTDRGASNFLQALAES